MTAPPTDAGDYPTDAESLWRLAVPTLERVYVARDQRTASARLWAEMPALRSAGYRLSAVSWVSEPVWSPAAWIGRRRGKLYATYSASPRRAVNGPLLAPSSGVAVDAAQSRPQVRVSVVIPTLNEARNLPHVLPHIPHNVHEVILVDGHSVDETVEVAQSLLPSIRVVIERRPGKGAALCTGFRAAEGDIIVMLDADGSTDPTEIPRFVDALLRGADFAKGSRFLADGGSTDISRLRAFGNRGLVSLVRLLFGGQYTDLCYGYNAFWASVLPILALDATGFEIETMMNVRALRHGLRISEVASFERSRIHGESNLKAFRDGWRILCVIVRERLSRWQTNGSWDEAREEALSGMVGDEPPRHLIPIMDIFPTGQAELAPALATPDGDPSLVYRISVDS